MKNIASNIWIVNNPYHLNDIVCFNKVYPGVNRYIYIPHRVIDFKNSDFVTIERYDNFRNLFFKNKEMKKILAEFIINREDRIFVFNGQELMNNAVVSFVYKKYCKNIYVVDDGSTGILFYLDKSTHIVIGVYDFVKIFLFRILHGIKLTITKFELNVSYYSLHKSFVKHLIFPYRVNHSTKLCVECILNNFTYFDCKFDDNSMIFVSQPFYLDDPGYLSYEDYIILLDKILNKLSQKSKIIYFISHPNDYKDLQTRLKINYNVQFVSLNITFETLLIENFSATIYGFNSNALLYSLGKGRKTVWLYKILPLNVFSNYLDDTILLNNGIIIDDLNNL